MNWPLQRRVKSHTDCCPGNAKYSSKHTLRFQPGQPFPFYMCLTARWDTHTRMLTVTISTRLLDVKFAIGPPESDIYCESARLRKGSWNNNLRLNNLTMGMSISYLAASRSFHIFIDRMLTNIALSCKNRKQSGWSNLDWKRDVYSSSQHTAITLYSWCAGGFIDIIALIWNACAEANQIWRTASSTILSAFYRQPTTSVILTTAFSNCGRGLPKRFPQSIHHFRVTVLGGAMWVALGVAQLIVPWISSYKLRRHEVKVLDLRSLGSLRSSEIEPAGSIFLSSDGRAQGTATGGEAAWCTDVWIVTVQQHEA